MEQKTSGSFNSPQAAKKEQFKSAAAAEVLL